MTDELGPASLVLRFDREKVSVFPGIDDLTRGRSGLAGRLFLDDERVDDDVEAVLQGFVDEGIPHEELARSAPARSSLATFKWTFTRIRVMMNDAVGAFDRSIGITVESVWQRWYVAR